MSNLLQESRFSDEKYTFFLRCFSRFMANYAEEITKFTHGRMYIHGFKVSYSHNENGHKADK